jgi:hypothetical protein
MKNKHYVGKGAKKKLRDMPSDDVMERLDEQIDTTGCSKCGNFVAEGQPFFIAMTRGGAWVARCGDPTRGGVIVTYQRALLIAPMRKVMALWDALLRGGTGLPPAPERAAVRLATATA